MALGLQVGMERIERRRQGLDVLVDVQRAGPSTGMPTNVEQSDLMQAIYGSHGDAPRVVLAPKNVEDCFYIAIEAARIARTLSRFRRE